MIIPTDKPAGMTSHHVAAKIKYALGGKIKIGHTGTLDPMCTGVLVILTGHDTKLSDLLVSDKEYTASLRLGIKTDTQDITGDIVGTFPVDITETEFKAVLESFTGDTAQIPPMYSALKVNGRKLYDIARSGEEIERASRTVHIYGIEYLGALSENEYSFHVKCSKGTYIRTLCDDIGAKLGCGGVMTSLRRTAANGFFEKDCLTLDDILSLAEKGKISEASVSAETAFRGLGSCVVPGDGEKYYYNGGILSTERLLGCIPGNNSTVRVYSESGVFLGLGICRNGEFKSVWQNKFESEI